MRERIAADLGTPLALLEQPLSDRVVQYLAATPAAPRPAAEPASAPAAAPAPIGTKRPHEDSSHQEGPDSKKSRYAVPATGVRHELSGNVLVEPLSQKGNKAVDLRKYYVDSNGLLAPTPKGVRMTVDEWIEFKAAVPLLVQRLDVGTGGAVKAEPTMVPSADKSAAMPPNPASVMVPASAMGADEAAILAALAMSAELE